MPDEKDEVILGADGKPLTKKALKNARRAAEVANRPGATPVAQNATQNTTQNAAVQKSPEIEKNVVKETMEEPKTEEIKKETEQSAAEPTQIASEPVFLDPKTGEPLTGKALNKARNKAKREALVKQRDGGSGGFQQKVTKSGSDAPQIPGNTVRSKKISFISKISNFQQTTIFPIKNCQ